MSLVKRINVNDGSGRSFEDNTVGEIVLDVVPTVNSFNGVTSDAVARAVAGASGEVPQVTENDNGKVLTATYDAGGPAVAWAEAQGGDVVVVEYTSDSMSDEDVRAVAAQIKAALTDGKAVVLNDVVNRGSTDGLRNEALLVYTTLSNDRLTAVFATPPNDVNALVPSLAHSCAWTMYVLTEAASGGTSTFARQGASVAQVPTTSNGKLYTEMTMADNGKVLRVVWDAVRHAAYAQWSEDSVATDGVMRGDGSAQSPVTLAFGKGLTTEEQPAYQNAFAFESGTSWGAVLSSRAAELITTGLHSMDLMNALITPSASVVLSASSEYAGKPCYCVIASASDGPTMAIYLGGALDSSGEFTFSSPVSPDFYTEGTDVLDGEGNWLDPYTTVITPGEYEVSLAAWDSTSSQYIPLSVDSVTYGDDNFALSFTVAGENEVLAVTNPLPSLTGNAGKVLAVNSGATGTEWVAAGGGADQPLPAVGTNVLRFEFEDGTFNPTNDAGCNFTGTSWAKVTEATTRNIWDCTLANDPASGSSGHFMITTPCHVIDGRYGRPLRNLFSGTTLGYAPYYASTGLRSVNLQLFGNAVYMASANYAFAGCTKLEKVRLSSSEGTTFSEAKGMFLDCQLLEEVLYLPPYTGGAAGIKGSTAANMFDRCYCLRTVQGFAISDTTAGLNANSMFKQCFGLESIGCMFAYVGASFNITDATSMFSKCARLKEIGSALKFSATSLSGLFSGCRSLERVALLDLNGTVTSMQDAFKNCCSLAEVNIINSGSVTNWSGTFDIEDQSSGAARLKLPTLDTSGATNVSAMFRNNIYADGALAMYQQLSQQANPPTTTTGCFTNCGANTVTGAAELAQIPSSWGGTGT